MTIWQYKEAARVVSEHLNKVMMKAVKDNRGHMLSRVLTREAFEGSEHSILRGDGSDDCNGFSMVSANHTVARHLDHPMELQEMEREFVAMGLDFARKLNIDFYNQIDKTLAKAGREVHHGSSPEDLLEILDDMWLDFEGPMRPRWPTMVCGSQVQDKITASWNELTTNPTLYKRLVDLVARKYHEWSDREAAKHLVD